MITLDIAPVPNQSISINLDNNLYDISIHNIVNEITVENGNLINIGNIQMAVTISRNNILLVAGIRATPGMWLLPYLYLEDGNFTFLTDNDDYPDYNQFGISQSLVYASPADLAIIRGP